MMVVWVFPPDDGATGGTNFISFKSVEAIKDWMEANARDTKDLFNAINHEHELVVIVLLFGKVCESITSLRNQIAVVR